MPSLFLHVGSNSYSYRYVHCVAVIAKNSSNYEVVETYLCFTTAAETFASTKRFVGSSITSSVKLSFKN
jgi:hypothetical protein